MSDLMYRYLEKYVGTYRVKSRYCLDTGDFPKDMSGAIDVTADDLFIECGRGEIRHSSTPYKLVWYTDKLTQGRGVLKSIEKQYKVVNKKVEYENAFTIEFEKNFKIFYEEIGEDVMIWFDDEDMKKIASIVKPKTNGKTTPPFSIFNLPAGDYVIPESDLKKLDTICKSLSKTEKMQLMKKALKDYDEVIRTKKGEKVLDGRKDSGLKSKEYIHYIGLWKDFLKYVKELV